MSGTQCSLFSTAIRNFQGNNKTLREKYKGGGELVCYQSMFRMNRFPLQTSYIPVCPILIDHAWLHLISSQTHYTFIASFFVLPYISFPPVFLCVGLFYRSPVLLFFCYCQCKMLPSPLLFSY